MAKLNEMVNLKAQAKYYQCMSEVLDYIDRQVKEVGSSYEVVGTREYYNKDTGETEIRDRYDTVYREYEELSDDDKALVDAWYLVYSKMSKM